MEIGKDSASLICATGRKTCCTDELYPDGNWYMPNGSQIMPQVNGSRVFYVSRRNQTVELNYVDANDQEVPTGIYHCEIADENNVINYLYVGIYPQNEGLTC